MTALLVGTALVFVTLLVRALALPTVSGLVRGWAWLYTLPLPPELRQRRRKEMAADLRDHVVTLRDKEGLVAEVVAVHVLMTWARSVPSDLLASLGSLARLLAGATWGRLSKLGALVGSKDSTTEQLQTIVNTYIAAGQRWPATARQIAAWANQNTQWQPSPPDGRSSPAGRSSRFHHTCRASDLARALRLNYAASRHQGLDARRDDG